jgi:hypothetical protein
MWVEWLKTRVCYNLVSEKFGFELVACPQLGWSGDVTFWYKSIREVIF